MASGTRQRCSPGLGLWTWRTYEVLAVIEWLHAYNPGRAEERKVRFVGIDPQRCGASITVLDTFLKERAPGRITGLDGALGVLAHARPGQHPDPQRRPVCAADELVAFLMARQRVLRAGAAVREGLVPRLPGLARALGGAQGPFPASG
ncbi:erythromycin esterase family protein [Streptomyces sp. MST-110588]|uniref:erythromycin esterase family protein n=1 Tax=Streptomyces sp. MST-110588 TaxID=2833628 RepID=UPI001F5C6302|nr:erythromycin esterase family protein [Streptomyces sp. MST-110588]